MALRPPASELEALVSGMVTGAVMRALAEDPWPLTMTPIVDDENGVHQNGFILSMLDGDAAIVFHVCVEEQPKLTT